MRSDKDFLDLFNLFLDPSHYLGDGMFNNIECIESRFGVKFPSADGKFWSFYPETFADGTNPDKIVDGDTELWEDYDNQEWSMDSFKWLSDSDYRPKSYPLLLVGTIEQDYDRLGPLSFFMINYVYPDDFTTGITIDQIKDE
jgi:hypothetical protein